MRPAIRIIFAPIFLRDKKVREKGYFQHGYTRTPSPGASREGTRTIYLDPRSSKLGETFLHEQIHIENPSWSERSVEEETKRRWNKMTWKDHARLWKLLASAHIEGEDD